jgi:hypothetical protein
MIAYLLFFLAGLGFGFAAEGKWRWLPLLFPLALGAWAIVKYGPDGSVLIRLVVALALTVLGVIVGTAIDVRSGAREDNPRYA